MLYKKIDKINLAPDEVSRILKFNKSSHKNINFLLILTIKMMEGSDSNYCYSSTEDDDEEEEISLTGYIKVL